MRDVSEQHIRNNCPFCDTASPAYTYRLGETDRFIITADEHALIEGHILIIPKDHIACVGQYSLEVWREFIAVYQRVTDFVKTTYGSVSSFEHGIIGQTVFHSHMHVLPFQGQPEKIIPEGKNNLRRMNNLAELQVEYAKRGKYLFFSIDNTNWLVNEALAAPRFFRDRFATALGCPERGNWKTMHADASLVALADQENTRLQNAWAKWAG